MNIRLSEVQNAVRSYARLVKPRTHEAQRSASHRPEVSGEADQIIISAEARDVQEGSNGPLEPEHTGPGEEGQ